MDDLVTWLRAQLDEDHEAAQVADALTRSPWTDEGGTVMCGDGHPIASVEDGEAATVEHIARWDPARVLAEVDAKRRILDKVTQVLATASEHITVESCDEDDAILAEGVLRLLAVLYADRPGYRDEWRP